MPFTELRNDGVGETVGGGVGNHLFNFGHIKCEVSIRNPSRDG